MEQRAFLLATADVLTAGHVRHSLCDGAQEK